MKAVREIVLIVLLLVRAVICFTGVSKSTKMLYDTIDSRS